MILYHGSTEIVEKPEIRKSSSNLDFGDGFYLTTSFEQAERWAKVKSKRNHAPVGYVSVYAFDYEAAEKQLTYRRFDTADEEWLKFVVDNRRGVSTGDESDFHIGPVADDNIYQSIRLFETGAYDAEYTVMKLKTEILIDQWALHTEKALSYLEFKEVREIR